MIHEQLLRRLERCPWHHDAASRTAVTARIYGLPLYVDECMFTLVHHPRTAHHNIRHDDGALLSGWNVHFLHSPTLQSDDSAPRAILVSRATAAQTCRAASISRFAANVRSPRITHSKHEIEDCHETNPTATRGKAVAAGARALEL